MKTYLNYVFGKIFSGFRSLLLYGFFRSFSIVFICLVSFNSSILSQSQLTAEKTLETMNIDGLANETAWSKATWYSISQLLKGTMPSATDFTGRYKLTWDQNYLYLLVEVTDNILSDDHTNPLTNWWDDDCIELFIDENRSKGDHQYNYNAFAYHVSLTYDVVDIGTDKNPHLYNDHIKTIRTQNGNKYTWECRVKIFGDSFVYGGNNTPLLLNSGKVMGFSVAYCDNDAGTTRESFMGSPVIPGVDKDLGYKTADYFQQLTLTSAGVLSKITLNPSIASIPLGEQYCPVLKGYDQFGIEIPITTTPIWTFTGSEFINGCFSFTNTGTYNITVSVGTISANAVVTVTEAPKLTSIVLTPAASTVKIGQTVQLLAVGIDQYGKNIGFTPEWSTTCGTITNTGLYTATTLGTCIVTVRSGSISASATINVVDNSELTIPGKIEAEDYCASGGVETAVIPTGKAVGYLDPNDWLQYCVNVTKTGAYKVTFKVASFKSTGLALFQLKSGSTILANVTVPNTGSWSTWQSINTTVSLTQGSQSITLLVVTGGFNLDWIDFSSSMKIEAESYTSMFGIKTETTTDVGGGLNVGFTDVADYIDYAVNVPVSDIYTFNFRVASNVATGKFELRNQTGLVLATLIQGTTGGWQTWVTKSVTANLTAGPQTLRIYYTGAGLNLNWFELVQGGLKSADVVSDVVNAPDVVNSVFPNPFMNSLAIKCNNKTQTLISFYDLSGKLHLSKVLEAGTGYINTTDLPKGVYLLKITSGQKTNIQKVIKQ
jgi:hypothetical protein